MSDFASLKEQRTKRTFSHSVRQDKQGLQQPLDVSEDGINKAISQTDAPLIILNDSSKPSAIQPEDCLDRVQENVQQRDKRISPVDCPSYKEIVNSPVEGGLVVRCSPEKGRGIYSNSTKTIEPGSTLLETSPLVWVLDKSNISSRCHFCFRDKGNEEHRGFGVSTGAEVAQVTFKLQQCGKCKVLKYCSYVCQKADWPFHSSECDQIISYNKQRKLERGSSASDIKTDGVPDTPIRLMGRLLNLGFLKKKKADQSWWSLNVDSMQSHRGNLPAETEESYYQMAFHLSRYLGSQKLRSILTSSADIMDFCSRVSSNSYNLTTPYDDAIGGCISPSVALINHSCSPNAVVVVPRFPSPGEMPSVDNVALFPILRVVALSPIKPGEQLFTTYLDIALPRYQRAEILRESYRFTCHCDLCEWVSETSDRLPVDPRERLSCGDVKKVKGRLTTCDGYVQLPDLKELLPEATVKCVVCGSEKDLHPQQKKLLLKEALGTIHDVQSHGQTPPSSQSLNIKQRLIREGFTETTYPVPEVSYCAYLALLNEGQFDQALRVMVDLVGADRLLYPKGYPKLVKDLIVVLKLKKWLCTTKMSERNLTREDLEEMKLLGGTIAEEVIIAHGKKGGTLLDEINSIMLDVTMMARLCNIGT